MDISDFKNFPPEPSMDEPEYVVSELTHDQAKLRRRALATAEKLGLVTLEDVDDYFFTSRDAWLENPREQRPDPSDLIATIAVIAGELLGQEALLSPYNYWDEETAKDRYMLHNPQHPTGIEDLYFFPIEAVRQRWFEDDGTKGPKHWVENALKLIYGEVNANTAVLAKDRLELAELAARGNLDKRLRQTHSFEFRDRLNAIAAWEALSIHGWQLVEGQPALMDPVREMDELWSLKVYREDLPINAENIAAQRRLCSRVACNYYGLYEGWRL